VSERANSDPGQEVEIFAALFIKHANALAPDEHHRRPAIGLDDVFRFELADRV
jgi:hypothetical protein